eukprot:GILI01023662.1.p1 GENE.GILI01023662.1~~GILI01023662.1.p1  ORF type:complete len:647 (-),score=165.19 GILI01023662.1:101-1951(-)
MVFDLVRFQSHEVEWADAQRRIVARETIKRRLQSGTNPKIALNDLRSILAGATVPMTSITISCGLVPTGELGSGANSDAMEGVLKKIFATANSTPNALAPGTSIGVSAASQQQQQRGSKLSMLDQMSMDSAKSFAAAMSGASQTQSSAQTAAAVTSSATDAHQAASLDLQNRQLATLFRSLERQVYCLPAAELVMGLSVAKQLTAFAEHHALSEGPYIGSHRHLHHHHHHHHHHHTNKNGVQQKKHIHNKQGSSRSGGYSSGGSGVEESGGSDAPNYPPPSAEEALLATAIAAVTGAKVMTQADGSGNEPISAASHVSSSTFRLESRFAAEVQLRSAINRYRAYKTSGTVDASVESAEAVRRANRKKQRQQALAEQQQQQTEHAADEPAGQVDQYLFSSPPQKLSAIQKNRSNLRDSADLQTHTSTTANSRQQLANSRSPLVTGAKVADDDDDDGEDQVIEDDEAVTEKTGTADSQYLGRKSRKEAAAAAASRTSKGATEGVAASSETPAATKRPRDDHDNTESKETPAVSQSQSVEQPSEPNPSKGRRVESAEVEAAPMHSTLVSSEEDAPVTEALSDRKPSSYQGLNAKRREEMAKRRSENLKKERFASEENLF